MSSRVKVDLSGMKQYQQKLKAAQAETDAFFAALARELAARLLAKVIKRTPVGETTYEVKNLKDKNGNVVTYKRGKNKGQVKQKKTAIHNGGTLRRGWTAKSEAEAASGKGSGQNAAQYAQSLMVQKVGNAYRIIIKNPTYYASYVEYGHCTSNRKGWVEGQFMLTISEMELRDEAPAIVARKIAEFLRRVMYDK